jgi:AcrR family transcriptional regulator
MRRLTRNKSSRPRNAARRSGFAKPARKRLKGDERKQFFIEKATKHFAHHSFSSSTSDLAKALGVSQSLLYKFYATKDELIDDVYKSISPTDEMYERWIRMLQERSKPLRARLIEFYHSYSDEMWGFERVRVLIWAQLFKPELSQHYHLLLESRLVPVVVRELRYEFGRTSSAAPAWREIEAVRALHEGLYYVAGHRRWIGPPPRLTGNISHIIELHIDLFLAGTSILRSQLD